MTPDAPPTADAGGPTPPAPPRPSALPDFGDCPEGWQPREVDGAHLCEPWARGEGPDCPDGEARLPSQSVCAPFGSPCPADGWPADLPDDGVVYVDADAAAGGDGTRASPFVTVAEALDAAADGDVIALHTGDYEGAVRADRPLTLRGACTRGTTLTSTAGAGPSATVTATAPGVAVRDLRIEGDLFGVQADGDGELTVREVWIDGVADFGAAASGGATLRGGPLVVRNTRSPDADSGQGVVGVGGSTIELDGLVSEHNFGAGVLVIDDGTEARVTDALLRRAGAEAAEIAGGAVAGRHARLVLERSVAEHNVAGGVFAQADGHAELTDVVLRDTLESPVTGDAAGGLSVQAGSTAAATRVLVEHNSALGIVVIGFDSTLDLTDGAVLATQKLEGEGFEKGGSALAVTGGARANVERLLCADNSLASILVEDDGATVSARDFTALRTRPLAGIGQGGRAISAGKDARVEVERMRSEDNAEIAVLAGDAGAVVTLTDATIVRTASRPLDGFTGRALSAQLGGRIEGERVVIRDSHEVGVLAHGGGTSISLLDAVVADTQPRTCAETTCDGLGAGMGVSSVRGALVEMERFVVSGHPAAGLQLVGDGQLRVHDGEVSDNAIGVNVQGTEPDLESLTDEVYYHDNGVKLDSQALPVPDPS